MYKETKKAVELIKEIKDIDFRIVKVCRNDDKDDVIQLKINESDFKKRLDLKHRIVKIIRERVPEPTRFYITGAI